jgi:hypothetical protein
MVYKIILVYLMSRFVPLQRLTQITRIYVTISSITPNGICQVMVKTTLNGRGKKGGEEEENEPNESV